MKNIIFDLGGVILKGTPVTILEKIDISNEEYNELIKFFQDWKNIDLGTQTLEEKFNKCNFSSRLVSKYKNILLNYYKIREININLIELINKLKLNNYNIYILSDNNKESFTYYKKSDLFKNVDGWVVSCDYNTVKKDNKLFQILLDKYNLLGEECYYIDDKEENINIARNYNIKGYIFNENEEIEKLYNDMKENGINV